jgi:hypothetical protein
MVHRLNGLICRIRKRQMHPGHCCIALHAELPYALRGKEKYISHARFHMLKDLSQISRGQENVT